MGSNPKTVVQLKGGKFGTETGREGRHVSRQGEDGQPQVKGRGAE